MGPQVDTAAPPKRSMLRRILWAIVIGGGALILINALLPDLDLSGQDRVALIRVEGVILDAQATISELKHYSENPLVKAIVLRIDSPGGGVVPSQEIHDAVKRVKNKSNKAVIASMGTVAASGGYYIAAATDRIIANPGTLTGSIGVIMEMANFEGLMKKVGVEGVVIKSGRFKDVGSPIRKMSEEERKLLQSVMDDVHHQFIQAVADGRSLEVSEVEPLADGRIYTGRQAKALGLVDEMGSMEDAVLAAAKTAGITGKPVLKEYGRSGFWEAIFGPSGQSLLGIFLGQLLQGIEGAHPGLHYPTGLPQLR